MLNYFTDSLVETDASNPTDPHMDYILDKNLKKGEPVFAVFKGRFYSFPCPFDKEFGDGSVIQVQYSELTEDNRVGEAVRFLGTNDMNMFQFIGNEDLKAGETVGSTYMGRPCSFICHHNVVAPRPYLGLFSELTFVNSDDDQKKPSANSFVGSTGRSKKRPPQSTPTSSRRCKYEKMAFSKDDGQWLVCGSAICLFESLFLTFFILKLRCLA